MKFSKFFESWLTGYYQNAVSVGKEGDFYTSVSVGSLFGLSIAKKISKLKKRFLSNGTCEKISVVEIGTNEGYLLADIIQGLFSFDSLNDFEFCVVEPHEKLREKQKEYFKKCFGDEIEIKHFRDLSEAKFKNAIFISNEIFDTFPCEVVDDDKMLFVSDFKPQFREIPKDVANLAKKYSIKNGEIPLNLNSFLKAVYESSDKFSFITFDYGDIKARDEITLRVYKNHNVYNFLEIENLKEFYQKSDITYDVNFSVLKSEFLEFDGVKFESYLTQANALIEFGVMEILEEILEKGGEIAYQNAANQLKRLMHPTELGERFKMIEFSKGI